MGIEPSETYFCLLNRLKNMKPDHKQVLNNLNVMQTSQNMVKISNIDPDVPKISKMACHLYLFDQVLSPEKLKNWPQILKNL
jgi:hypothetical protein